jgi:hypothetical protein
LKHCGNEDPTWRVKAIRLVKELIAQLDQTVELIDLSAQEDTRKHL